MSKRITPLFALIILAAAAPPVRAEPRPARTVEYQSPAVGRTLRCIIYLPANYELSGKRYPVLYLLHGYSGDYTSWSRHDVGAATEPYDWIVVLPDGGNSWFVNWAESDGGEKNNWEDAIIKDLVGYVDAHYRTVASRAGRAINGLSMGGYGAMAIGLRHPELFCSVGSHSGALDLARSCARQLKANPDAKIPARNPSAKVNAAIGLDDFDSQEERTPHGRIFATVEQCEAHDPFTLVTKVPREALPHLYVDCGTEDPLFGQSQEFLKLLLEKKIPCTYAQSPGEHRGAYWKREIHHSMAVQYQIIARSLAEDSKAPQH